MPYCTRCGKLMKEGSKFCTACGAPLEETGAVTDRTTALPREETPRTEEATRVMPHAEPVPPSSTASMPPVAPGPAAEQTPKPKSKAPLVIALIVAIAAVAILIFILVTGAFLPGTHTESDTVTTEQSDAAKNSKNGTGKVEVRGDPNVAGDEDDDSDDETDNSYEKTVYDELTRYYDDLEGLDASVRSCATEFNQSYLETDYSTRQSASSTASNLEDKIDDALDELEKLDVEHSSKNYSSWRGIINLYQDLEHRIDVICDAWEIDLRYDDPSSSKDEIIAPLSKDNVTGTNDNKYRLDYEKNYSAAKPVEP